MSRRIRLAIDVSDQRAPALTAMAARSRSLQVCEQAFTALVTDQAGVAIEAVADNKHVLVLDPFAIPRMERGQLESSGRALPALTARFQPSTQQVKQALDGGKLGEQGLLRIHCWQSSLMAPSDSLQCQLDLAVWFFGQRPSEVYGCQRPGYVQAHLGFRGGGMALIDVDTRMPDANSYHSLSLIGSRGAAYADDDRNMNLLFADDGPLALRASQRNVGFANMIDAFAKGIIAGQEFATGWQQIESVLEVADQVHAAVASGRVIAGGRDG